MAQHQKVTLDVVEPLIKLLSSVHQDVVTTAANALGEFAAVDQSTRLLLINAEAVDPCVKLLSSTNHNAVTSAACFLGNLAKDNTTRSETVVAIDPLVQQLEDASDANVIVQVARTLGYIGEDQRYRDQVISTSCVDILLVHIITEPQVRL